MHESRFIIGIDLGTTTSTLSFIDTKESPFRIQHFSIPQLIAPGEIDSFSFLSSFCYLPQNEEFSEDMLALPWLTNSSSILGKFAQRHGSTIPSRLISSAKSWLAHAGVDRSKPILPWGNLREKEKKSPVEVSSFYLWHIKDAWNHAFSGVKDQYSSVCKLEEQQVILTIPASFDEAARELTIQAATMAGYRDVTLLEEPLAAFYSWLHQHGQDWRQQVNIGENILVIDVGGGTTDFSLIEVKENYILHRSAVGEHLLLGGDNIDMTIAHKIENEWGKKLPGNDWTSLCHLCREAKESLLSESIEKVDITLLKRGSSLLGNTQTALLKKSELFSLLEEGFLPNIEKNMRTPRKLSGIREMGLPYAQYPAITMYLLEFLRYAARITSSDISMKDGSTEGRQQESSSSLPEAEIPLLYPHKVLFNGGTMVVPWIRQRILSVLSNWCSSPSEELQSTELFLAVSMGAAYYGSVRRGFGVQVKSGVPRSFYLDIKDTSEKGKVICIMAKGTVENQDVVLPQKMSVRTNEKVRFNLYSSSTRLLDHPGDIVDITDDLTLVAPLITVLQFGKSKCTDLEVKLCSKETEVGTLKIHLLSTSTDHQWPLRFDLRAISEDNKTVRQPSITMNMGKISQAKIYIRNTLKSKEIQQSSLNRYLEELVDHPKKEWSIGFLREIADELLEIEDVRHLSWNHEVRWINLLGFSLRPGFGDPEDRLRLKKIWQLWFQGVCYPKQLQIHAEWWVLWRRIAPGLTSGHQLSIANFLRKRLFPKTTYRTSLQEGKQAKREMWRCFGALEKLTKEIKSTAASILLERKNYLDNYEFWVLGRLGSRKLFHAPEDVIILPSVVEIWIEDLLSVPLSSKINQDLLFAVSRMARLTGSRCLDISESTQRKVLDYLHRHSCKQQWIKQVREKTSESFHDIEAVLADSLPLGLSLVR